MRLRSGSAWGEDGGASAEDTTAGPANDTAADPDTGDWSTAERDRISYFEGLSSLLRPIQQVFNCFKPTQRQQGSVDLSGAEDFEPSQGPYAGFSPLPEHDGSTWPETPTFTDATGSVYEVHTPKEDYLISTRMVDFIGLVDEDGKPGSWTPQVEKMYKLKEKHRKAKDDAQHEYARIARDGTDEEKFSLQLERFHQALTELALRLQMLYQWPSAFEKHGGTDSHRVALPYVKREIANARQLALDASARAWPGRAQPALQSANALLRVVDKSVFAFRPDEYVTFRDKIVTDRAQLEDPLRVLVNDPNDPKYRAEDYQYLNRQLLPPLRPGFPQAGPSVAGLDRPAPSTYTRQSMGKDL